MPAAVPTRAPRISKSGMWNVRHGSVWSAGDASRKSNACFVGRWTFDICTELTHLYPIGNFPPWLFPTVRTSSPPRQDRSCNPPSFPLSLTIRHRYDFHLHFVSPALIIVSSHFNILFFFNPVKIQVNPQFLHSWSDEISRLPELDPSLRLSPNPLRANAA